jgi:hypothetical protein
MLGFHNGAGILAGVPYLEPAVAGIIRGPSQALRPNETGESHADGEDI